MLASAKYNVTCKMDLVETAPDPDDLFDRLKACPVEYKVGTPQVGEDGVRIWDSDKIQLGLQFRMIAKTITGEIVIYHPFQTR
jgi:hypothetical protein